MKKQDTNDYREAQRIELHAQSKIFESIPNRKLLKARIDGPYMLHIKFIELNYGRELAESVRAWRAGVGD